ncbi:MAG: hypothetical protein ACWGSD_19530 [Thermodesulfobacteriota bacterium]
MRKIVYQLSLPGIVLAIALSSCAHTKVLNSWKDPEYAGYPKKVLVHAIAWNPTVKILAENELVTQFESHGMVALPSHKFLPDQLHIDREAMKKVVQEHGIDTVFVAGPTGRADTDAPGPNKLSATGTVYAPQNEGFALIMASFAYTSDTYVGETVLMKMVLYDVALEKRVWSANVKTSVWNTPTEEVKPGIKVIVERLLEDKMIPQGDPKQGKAKAGD